MYSGISEELQRQAVACKLAGKPVVTAELGIATMQHEPKLTCWDGTDHVFKIGDRVCVRSACIPAVVTKVARLITIIDIFGATAHVLPQKLAYACKATRTEVALFKALGTGNFFYTSEMKNTFADVNIHILDMLGKIYSTSEDGDDDEC